MKKTKGKKMELKPMVMIGLARNGWVIQIREDDEGEFEYTTKVVAYDEDTDEELGEKKALKDLLWYVLNGIGEYHSKHNKYNVVPAVIEYETQKEIE